MMEKQPKRPAVFLDRDGVIIVDKDFQVNPGEIELFPETVEALSLINSRYLKIVISNQSGIARGYFTEDDVDRFNNALSGKLWESGVRIDGWYFCPHGPDDSCLCRKPLPGMITSAAIEHNIDLDNSWLIGDKTSDIEAGRASGIRAILVKTGYGGREDGALESRPVFAAENILDAVNYINRSLN